jgi:methionine synthase II (cobalamin-independent)
MVIDKDISIEELVDSVPGSVKYLMNEGIKCIACGEPIWGTLEEAALEKGFNEKDIQHFVDELNKIAKEESGSTKEENQKKFDVKRIDS